MRGRLKRMGLALVAVAALGAVGATAALATTHSIELEAVNETAILTGTTHVGKTSLAISTLVGPGHLECVGHYAATVNNGAKSLTFHKTLTECTAFGSEATVATNHCAYVFENAPTSEAGDAPVEAECAEGSKIELIVPSIGCTLKFGPQTPGGGVHYTNVQTAGKPMEITLHMTLTNVTFEKVGSCGLITGKTATVEDTVTINAWKDLGEPLSGTAKTTPEVKEGAQIGVTANPGGLARLPAGGAWGRVIPAPRH